MLMHRMANYLTGSAKIHISGAIPEKFINLCMSEGIFLWNITKVATGLTAYIRLSDFFYIRPIARKSATKVRVLGRSGLPFLKKKIMRRKMLLVGALVFIILLQYLTSFVWFIEIRGIKALAAADVKQVAYTAGLKLGVSKNKVDVKNIEREILYQIPEVAWASVAFTGTRVVIEIVEKTMPKQEDKSPANIVAAKDGIITELITLTGKAAITKNSTVKKGDILIYGQDANMNPIKANGLVKARVWYEGYGEVCLEQPYFERTGNREIGVVLKIGDQEMALKPLPKQPYSYYEEEVAHKNLLFWRNRNIAVESTIHIYYELAAGIRAITLETAREEAKASALTAVQNKIPETAQIIWRNIEVLNTAEDNIVRVKVGVETLEDIGQSVIIQ